MNNNDFASFLDDIREARNMSREEFIDGIVSLRQYYRFIKGDSTLKSDVILSLIDRLELNNALFFEYFKVTRDEEYSKLLDIYKYIYLHDLKKANELYEHIENHEFLSNSTKKMFKFITLLLKVKQNLISYNDASEELIEVIDYPKILDNEVLNFVEKSTLSYLTNYLISNKDYRIARFFQRIVNEEIAQDKSFDRESVTFRNVTIKSLAKIGDHEEALKIIKHTEEKFLVSDNVLPMINLYYYKALEEKSMFEDNRYIKSLQKYVSLVNLSDSEEFQDKYYSILKKRFNIKPSDIVDFKQ